MNKFLSRLLLPLVLAGLLTSAYAAEPAGATTRTLYLVRHGFYDYTAGADDKTGNALNALGREQAGDVADRLAIFPVKFTSATSSEFLRARETGDIIAAKLGLPCSRDGLLNECSPAGAGLAPKPEQPAADAQLAQAWAHYTAPVTGSSVHELLVCHGNVIRWFVCRALGEDPKPWTQMEIANCSITVIQVRPDGSTRVQIFNDIAHIPTEKQTWAGKGPGWPLPAQTKAK